VLLVLLGASGILFAPLSGCDPAVQDTVLGGANEFAVTLIDAFFLMFAADDTAATTAPVTVEAITKAMLPLIT
jgi:hypothetical protein